MANENNFNFNASRAPQFQLPTNRGLLKTIILSALTFGIYALYIMSRVSTDINTIATRYDGRTTMHYLVMAFLVTPLTFGIAPLVWSHRLYNRIGCELIRRRISYPISAVTFWGWNTLGLLIGIGPLVAMHKLFRGMNLLSEDYNKRG